MNFVLSIRHERQSSQVRLLLLAMAGVFTSTGASLAQPMYVFRDLGDLGGGLSLAAGVNEQGHIVGYAYNTEGNQRAVIWRDGGIFDLGTLGGRNSSATDINELGEIVGTSDTPERATNAFVVREGVMFDLGRVPGDSGSNAQAINESGQVLANSVAIDRPLAFLFSRDGGRPTFLGDLGIPETWAWDLNDAGVAVGWSTDDEFRRSAFRWEAGTMISMGSLIGLEGESVARGINSQGDICGCSSSNDGQRAFIWRDGAMSSLGVLPNGVESCAQSVNDLSQVVGFSFVDPGFEAAPFIWQAGRMYDLNDLTIDLPAGARVYDALDINNRGQVVGQLVFEDTTYHGFLLTPMMQVSDPFPGNAGELNTFVVTGATPGSRVTLAYADDQGTTAIPGCSDRFAQLSDPRIVGHALADGSGRAEVRVRVPAAGAGRRVLIQCLDRDACNVSNLKEVRFD